MQKNVPTFFWLLFFQFLHGSKGEFLNYILKCNRLKSTNVQPEKKKWHTEQGMKNFVYKWLQKTFGSSRLAKLSAQECNLGTPGEVWQPALTRHGDCWTGGQRLPVCCTLCLHNRNFQEPGRTSNTQSRKGKTSGIFTVQHLANTLNHRKDCQLPCILLAMALTSPKLRVHLCLN